MKSNSLKALLVLLPLLKCAEFQQSEQEIQSATSLDDTTGPVPMVFLNTEFESPNAGMSLSESFQVSTIGDVEEDAEEVIVAAPESVVVIDSAVRTFGDDEEEEDLDEAVASLAAIRIQLSAVNESAGAASQMGSIEVDEEYAAPVAEIASIQAVLPANETEAVAAEGQCPFTGVATKRDTKYWFGNLAVQAKDKKSSKKSKKSKKNKKKRGSSSSDSSSDSSSESSSSSSEEEKKKPKSHPKAGNKAQCPYFNRSIKK